MVGEALKRTVSGRFRRMRTGQHETQDLPTTPTSSEKPSAKLSRKVSFADTQPEILYLDDPSESDEEEMSPHEDSVKAIVMEEEKTSICCSETAPVTVMFRLLLDSLRTSWL
mmetsp:Transcript_54133/g.152532  ORF Transcript_54133/g.152532 Transcript_54133/m.152532 type:complete len:112 (+) Transcript_54133:52-387(+)